MAKRNNLLWLFAGVFWTVIVGGYAWYEIASNYSAVIEHARIEARSSYNKDLVYRRWAAGHGGVYAPATEKTPPNPFLKDIPERDIETPSGRLLTLINPAYMTRQVYALGKEQYGVRGHITSLNPIAPYNKADPWETTALQSLQNGKKSIETVALLEGEKHLRTMYPMWVEPTCLKCHRSQGYEVGDLRGGISVSVPIEPYLAIHNKDVENQVVYHSGVWALGLFGIFLARLTINRQFKQTERALQQSLYTESELSRKKLGFEKVQELGQIGGWELDLKNNVLEWSDENCRIFGVAPGTVVDYQKFLEKVHPDDRALVDREWKKALDGVPYDIEHRLLIDDEVKWVREKADFIYDNDGNIEGAVGLTQDITQRKEIEAQIIASEEKFRTLYDESPLPYHSLDAEGRFIEVNPAWLKLLGYDEDEVIGKNYGDFLHPDWQPVFAEKFPVFKESGRVHDVHFKIRHKDGHYIDISLGGCISSHPDGTFKNTNCVFVDISDRIQAEADRKQMEAQTIRASQLATLGELSAGVAHEINNPISGVINYAQMILNKADQGTREEDLSNRIINEGERIANIVSKLLSFSRKEEGEHQPHDIRSIIDIPLSLLSKKLEQDGITVNVSIANDVPVLHCNAQQMEQVLLNLINNAQYALNKKYPSPSPEKIIEINVDTLMEKGKPYISLAVKDYGEGIPADVLPEIFGAFYTTKEAGVGTGLGLSIIESIVKIHDGQIKVESEEGEYTNIIIAFPVYG